jgi:AcrR family transcriptional regulator
MARKPDNAPARRQEILEHFYEVLKSEGIEGASNAKIASHMNINPSLIYHYFASKEEMFVELVQYLTEQYKKAFSPLVDQVSDPERRLEIIIDTLFSRDWVQFIDMGAFYSCYALSFRNESVRRSIQGMYLELRRHLAEEIGALIEAGVIAPAAPDMLADAVIALLEGYDYYRCLMLDDKRFDELGGLLKENALAMLKYGYGRVVPERRKNRG